MPPLVTLDILENLYSRYNDRQYADLDPIVFLYRYENPADREVAGLVAASLAYGNVKAILRSVEAAVALLGESPAEGLRRLSWRDLQRTARAFRHRWTTGDEVASLLSGMQGVLGRWGSLEACFLEGVRDEEETLLPALSKFVDQLYCHARGIPPASLLPLPERGSASKRLHLFLRWMVRRDAVDPGGWDRVPRAKLVVPLDTHMHRIGLALGLTERKQAGLRAALDITGAFRRFSPGDPVKYDFCLTRLGILKDADLGAFLRRCGAREAAG